jgi:hypothetical protein
LPRLVVGGCVPLPPPTKNPPYCVRKGEQRSDSALRAVGERVQQWKQRNRALQSKLMHVEQARQDDAELCIVM